MLDHALIDSTVIVAEDYCCGNSGKYCVKKGEKGVMEEYVTNSHGEKALVKFPNFKIWMPMEVLRKE